EYAGSTIRSMSMEGRLTICNMSIEAGARIGMIAPDETTYKFLSGRRHRIGRQRAPSTWVWGIVSTPGIEMGISAVHWAVGGPTAPYFRFPALRQPQELIDYLGKRNIAIFSADMDSFDFKMRKPEQVRQSVMDKLKKHGKGIVLVHDFQHATAEAAMDLLNDLK